MTSEEFVRLYPQLYHMASATAFDQIERHGLLSSASIVKLLGLEQVEQTDLLCKRRAQSQTCLHPLHGEFTLRDQKPINETLLKRKLSGLTLEEFYTKLNERVFLWASEERVERLLGAKAYRSKDHLVFTVDSGKLIAVVGGALELSSFNTGACSFPNSPVRDTSMFSSLTDFDSRAKVVEVTIRTSIPNFTSLAREPELRRAVKR